MMKQLPIIKDDDETVGGGNNVLEEDEGEDLIKSINSLINKGKRFHLLSSEIN